MKIRMHPSDGHGTGWYRMREPGRVVQAEGHEVEITNKVPTRPLGSTGRHAAAPVDADVMIFQRVANPAVLTLIPGYQAQGIACVVDMDDDMHALHRDHPSFHTFHPDYGEWSWRTMGEACAIVDMVTVTSPALAKLYGAHGRVAVVPNAVPKRLLSMPRESKGNVVGWTGTTIQHPGDLAVTHGGVGEALEQSDAVFRHIGLSDGVREALSVSEDRFLSFGPAEYEEYCKLLGCFDVGICPLADTRFNAGKSYLKPLEFAARGIAWVGSPRAEYARFAESTGSGLLAKDRARNWRSAVVRLLKDEALRTEQVETGRTMVELNHTTEGNAWRWLEAWEQAIQNRRLRAPTVRKQPVAVAVREPAHA